MNLINKIDYTLLNPSATEDQIIELCKKANDLGVKSVCVLPKMVSVAVKELKNSNVLICTVISFPHGTDSTEDKLEETKKAIADGADECDMVLNYHMLKKCHIIEDLVDDVSTLVTECHLNDVILKVIVESGLLSEDETTEATQVCLEAGADFIKTSTGMVSVGAELRKVQIMKNIITDAHSHMKIKASGAIRTMSDIERFEPYVDRFGVGFAAVDSIFDGQTMGDNSY